MLKGGGAFVVVITLSVAGCVATGQDKSTSADETFIVTATKRTNPRNSPFPLTCDASQCKTKVYEVHQDSPGDTTMDLYFAPPSGIVLNGSQKDGVEVEGGGATHWVHALGAGSNWLKCQWYAKKHAFKDNGLAKGYCWVAVAK